MADLNSAYATDMFVYSDFENELNNKYASIDTVLGKLNFKHTVMKNPYISQILEYEMWINTEYNPLEFSPFEITYGTKLSESDKMSVVNALANLQNSIFNDATLKYPNVKIRGGFLYSYYEYPTLKVGYKSTSFLTWNNYSSGNGVFSWDTSIDDYKFDAYLHSTANNISTVPTPSVTPAPLAIESTNPAPSEPTATPEPLLVLDAKEATKTDSSGYYLKKGSHIYKKASTKSTKIAKATKNIKTKPVAKTKDGKFYKVTIGKVTGYVTKKSIGRK